MATLTKFWKTNRVLGRREAERLELGERIRLEKSLTDAEQPRPNGALPAPDLDEYCRRSPWRSYLFDFLGAVAGRTVLDLGCGYHPTPVLFAMAGARQVFACDVSPRAVEYAVNRAHDAGVGDRVVPLVSAGERLPLPDACVDLVHGEAVLHHLCLPLAGAELRRVLKRGGKAAFKDPLGQNPLLEFARDHLPYAWKAAAKGTDRPLRFGEIEQFGRHFRRLHYRGFGLLSMAAVALFGRGDHRPKRLSHRVDEALLRAFPLLGRFCRFVVTCVEK